MKTMPILFRCAGLSAIAALFLAFALNVRAAAPAPAAAAKPAPTNAPPVIVIVKSVFESSIKDNPALKDYKDPFFPNSLRIHPPPPEVPKPTPAGVNPNIPPPPPPPPKKKVSFMALSGLTKRIALINSQGRTYEFGKGESDVIPTPAGDAKVKCLEIKKNSVVLQLDDEKDPVELRLPSDLSN